MRFRAAKNKRPQSRWSIVYGWILSYVLIILIPVTMTGLAYWQAKRIIEDEINNSNTLMLENIRDSLDSTLSQLDKFSTEIEADQYVRDAYQMKTMDSSSYYTLYMAASAFSHYKILSGVIQNSYVYLKDIKMVVTPGTVNTDADYFDDYLSDEGYTFGDWSTLVGGLHNGEFATLPRAHDRAGANRDESYIRSFPILSFGDVSANLVITLNFDSLLANVSKDRNALIVDGNNTIVAQSDRSAAYPGLRYDRMKGQSGILTDTIGGRSVVLSYIKSGQNTWKYITVTPTSVFWQRAEYIRSLMLGGLILCVLMGSLLSYYFIRRNYGPVRAIVDSLRLRQHVENPESRNEFAYLQKVINTAFEEKEKIQHKLDRQNEFLKSDLIASLIRGRRSSAPVDELLTSYDIAFRYEAFTVVLIFIESMDEGLWKAGAYRNADPYDLAVFSIRNVVEEIMNRRNIGFVAEVGDMLACIVNTGSSPEALRAELKQDTAEAKNFLAENFAIRLRFSVGDVHIGIPEIPESYREAVTAMEYARVMELEGTVFYPDIAGEEDMDFYYPVAKEHRLVNYIQSADSTRAGLVLEDIFRNDLMKNSTSVEITRFLMMNLVGTVMKTFRAAEDEDNRKFIEKTDPARQLMACRTLTEMKNMMAHIIQEVCRYNGSQRAHTGSTIRDTVRRLVHENYADSSFGIGGIASVIGKTPYYISKIFKEETGEGILEYLNGTRVEKAKELLKNGSFNQNQIAEKVGFTNVRTFQRVFKKREGVTPGKIKTRGDP